MNKYLLKLMLVHVHIRYLLKWSIGSNIYQIVKSHILERVLSEKKISESYLSPVWLNKIKLIFS